MSQDNNLETRPKLMTFGIPMGRNKARSEITSPWGKIIWGHKNIGLRQKY